MTAAVDTSVLFARQSKRDQYHEPAREIIAGVDHGELPAVYVTNYVLAETLNLIANKGDHRTAVRTLDALVEGRHFEIEHAPKTDFDAAQALFRRHSHLSFVDASIVAYMQREDVTYLYSFDDDFDAIDGITRVNTAVDPR